MAGNLGVEYKMRLSEDLRNRIKESAKQYNRSMNQDIVARLEQSFTAPRPPMTFREVVEDTAKIQDDVFEINNAKVQELENKIDIILQEIQALKKPTA